ncbi:MAG TPA: hypothetical protein VJL87_05505, partial [Bdellovibrionota bacterium]|nr:hypothetical protein [Bdellovibrionota bacterium]
FADIDPIKDDLSGGWRIDCKDEGKGNGINAVEFLATKTSIKASYSQGKQVVYSLLFQNPRGEDFWFPFFAFTTLEHGGKKSIVWYQTEMDLYKKAIELDGESSLILGVQGDTLILGGDFEEEELCRMTRIPDFGPAGN